MPFGMKNASTYFQLIVDLELVDLSFVKCYIDDILIYSKIVEEHIEHIEIVLDKLARCGLKVHPKKCSFAFQQIEYLGHLITPDGLEPQLAKVAAITQMPRPADVAVLRAFLGLMNYYRKFLPQMSTVCAPLYALLKKNVE